ncbi:MAG: c-type cytochrome, partial [Verrucomicrobiales bacterium]|nr:c-type cytochrome [Verrucomicrobiales bacterium]
YEEVPGKFADGTPYSLRKPTYTFDKAPHLELSPRIAPPVFGVGLLEAVEYRTTLQKLTDSWDANGDGISGHVNYIPDSPRSTVVGWFGWKANQHSVRTQTAAAFFHDMGVSSDFHLESFDKPEIDRHNLERVVLYLQTLAPPAQRDRENPAVMRGEKLFRSAKCAVCHVPELQTGKHPDGIAQLSNQVIRPFTDLLLHNMGDGLADGLIDHSADGDEWRTPPLWGIGLTETVSGHTFFLHDGRARNLTEAILWHGGEGADSAESFRKMTAKERDDLLAFLNSL